MEKGEPMLDVVMWCLVRVRGRRRRVRQSEGWLRDCVRADTWCVSEL
jgi:hypothetical protein